MLGPEGRIRGPEGRMRAPTVGVEASGTMWKELRSGRRGSALVSVDLYDSLSGVPDQIKSVRESALGRKLLDVSGVTKP